MNSLELQIVLLTIQVAFISTLTTLPLAIWLGWILARYNIPGKPIIEALLTLPLVAPPVVSGYVMLLLLGKNGIFGSWLYDLFNVRLTFNFSALVIASVVVSLPLAVRSIRSAFELVDPSYEKASLTLGASRFNTFFRISLPMALPGIVSGIVLSFARSLGEFGATITLAGNIAGKTQTLSLMVYSNMQIPGKEMQVTRLVFISIAISIIAITISELINKRGKYLSK